MKLFLLFVFLTSCALRAEDIAIIAHPGVKASDISADDVKLVFLGSKTALSDGSPVTPVLAKDGSIHDAFLKTYVGKSDAALRNHYKSLVFTGKGSMPKTLDSDAAIAAYVAGNKGAIGYVAAGANTGGAKKLNIK
ncbi:MAG: hypothetical protein NTV70_05515 [Acidobacteria bacterium]|nr:hypothetical protein [Acidobacteriota bacterium]